MIRSTIRGRSRVSFRINSWAIPSKSARTARQYCLRPQIKSVRNSAHFLVDGCALSRLGFGRGLHSQPLMRILACVWSSPRLQEHTLQSAKKRPHNTHRSGADFRGSQEPNFGFKAATEDYTDMISAGILDP